MGHSIPVMYMICDSEQMPPDPKQWTDANPVLDKAFKDPSTYSTHAATARNWWQIEAVKEARDRNGLHGLDFFDTELAVLSEPDVVKAAIDSMAVIIQQYQQEVEDIVEINSDNLPVDIDCDDDPEVGYLLFLSSMVTVMQKALGTTKSFLFVQPQP